MVGILAAWGLVGAHIEGPSDPVSGVPGEGTCADVACHTSFALNSGPGSFMLTAHTATAGEYTPGDTVDIDVDISQTGMIRWGFQLTAIDGASHPAGTILLSQPTRTQVQTGAGGRQYLMHTALGTDSGAVNTAPGWTFKWKAPAAGAGPVTFYAAGNAADGDGTSLGDWVYTTSLVLTEGPQSVHEGEDVRPGSFALEPNYPNPFNAGTRIAFRLDAKAAGPVTLEIHDITGRRVRLLYTSRFETSGEHSVAWDGLDDLGKSAPSGAYLVQMTTRAGADARKVLLLR